ncbi:blr0497 [Bradyrhizobium diazoefficiens USDA 110]|uniref:Blr0497 protein n=2 Tax=Bradyrhizobium diazoefficiens TaxID=1355477 RepID=Q89X25_BRADU|nr:hypothetical protein CO678_09440 [Bradyrhizobium diazoefficiens]QBP19455.1 hypothetical protein Bdiaspc4_02185 [Bradyrhizobium diazoefficiens]BAC45762.1 blr0497 [Bradyrhizobium diazoefficiens USDA 110]
MPNLVPISRPQEEPRMSTASRPYPIVQDLIDSFASWLKHRREMNEMRQLDRADFDRIASDLRIAPDDLEELVRHGKHAADELPKMLEQLGISAEGLGRAQPLLLRDMERVCSLCGHKGQCDRDLADGTAAENYHGYCGNAATLESLDRADLAPR